MLWCRLHLNHSNAPDTFDPIVVWDAILRDSSLKVWLQSRLVVVDDRQPVMHIDYWSHIVIN